MKTKNLENIIDQIKAFIFISFIFSIVVIAPILGIKYIGNFIKDQDNDQKIYDFIFFKEYICETTTNKYKVSAEKDWEFDIVNDEYYFKKNDLLILVRNCKEVEKLK